jgi:hypothetical protein
MVVLLYKCLPKRIKQLLISHAGNRVNARIVGINPTWQPFEPLAYSFCRAVLIERNHLYACDSKRRTIDMFVSLPLYL